MNGSQIPHLNSCVASDIVAFLKAYDTYEADVETLNRDKPKTQRIPLRELFECVERGLLSELTRRIDRAAAEEANNAGLAVDREEPTFEERLRDRLNSMLVHKPFEGSQLGLRAALGRLRMDRNITEVEACMVTSVSI